MLFLLLLQTFSIATASVLNVLKLWTQLQQEKKISRVISLTRKKFVSCTAWSLHPLPLLKVHNLSVPLDLSLRDESTNQNTWAPSTMIYI